MTKYQYKECGLDYVYLLNGFTVHETPYGNGVSIKNAEKLHKVIADCIVTGPQQIHGREIRFLRSVMDVSQKRLGEMLGVERGRIAQIEAEKDEPITMTMDNLMRYRYASFMKEDSILKRMCEYLDEIDEQAELETVLCEDEGGNWQCGEKIAA